MSYYLSVNELHIPYEIERTRRRTYGITMKPGGAVIVCIPMRGSISYARTMIEDKKVQLNTIVKDIDKKQDKIDSALIIKKINEFE